MEVGIEGGLNRPFFTKYESYEDEIQSNNAYTIGAMFQYNINPRYSIRTNISFDKRRFYTGNYQYTNEDIIVQLDNIQTYWNRTYVTLPILGRLTFGDKVKFFVNAGPHFGLMFENEKQFDEIISGDSRPNPARNLDFSLNHQFKRFDMGISAGIGMSVDIGEKFVGSLEARDNTGLFNISKLDADKVKNNGVNVLFGFAYKIIPKRKLSISNRVR
jgi:hypothetical protein